MTSRRHASVHTCVCYTAACFRPRDARNGGNSGRLIITARHTLNVMVILYSSLVHIHFPSCLGNSAVWARCWFFFPVYWLIYFFIFRLTRAYAAVPCRAVPDGRGSDAARSAPRLYLAEMPQPLINLSLGSSWDTGPATLCHSNLPSRHNTKTLHPSSAPPLPQHLPILLSSSLPTPNPLSSFLSSP